jgi:LuxR family maltose regulon positive regulatory protein
VLVAAPAGFGKTTLLTQWLHATADSGGDGQALPRIAWLSLDAEDSDPRRFLGHLIAALQATSPPATESDERGLGIEAVQLLEADTGPFEDVLVSLINDLDTQAGRTVIALDDYHVIENTEVHQAVAFVLDNLPPQVTIAMATRADPLLPVARLRARGELVELRAGDLRFTHHEATQFLNDTMGLDLDPALVTALGERTEGWVAGLQLAALSARTSGDDTAEVTRFVESFSGSHRFVLDYLVEEVLSRQPDDVRTFLLATSVLTQLTAGLCDAVTGRTDSQDLLEQLEADGLFVISLDEERRWFRYHHLFADALRARVPSDLPGRADALHAAAAHWLTGAGLLSDAIHHALAGNDHDYAADLIELALGDQRRRRQDTTLREWATRLDLDVVRHRPLLATFAAWSRLAHGDVDGVEPWLDAADASMDTYQPAPFPPHGPLATAVADRDAELRGLPSMVSVYRAAVAQARGDTDGTVTHARHALTLAGPTDHFARGAASGFVGLAAWAAGDLETGVDTFNDAIASLEAAGMRADALGSTVVLAQMWLGRGQPHWARGLYERAIAEATKESGPPLSTTGDLYVGLAGVLCEEGNLDAAEQHLHVARSLGDRASLPENRHRWFTTAAVVRRALGDLDGADALLGQAEALYLPGYFPDVRPVAAARARVWVAMDRLEDARGWARSRELLDSPETDGADGPVPYLREYDLLTLVRLQSAQGAHADAKALASRVLDAAASSARDGSILEAHLTRALAHHAAGDLDAAVVDLAAALTLGVPAGYRRLFLDEGAPAHELLAHVAAQGPPEAGNYAQQLLSTTSGPDVPTYREPGLAGPSAGDAGLSDRELEVLRLLDSELTGPEIARHLFVSVNTLRSHTKHVFTKLDVNTRRAAVRRATELGLL